MDNETKNVVLVALSIIMVFVIVLGGGYWYFNHGEELFTKGALNKTIIPKKKQKVEPGEYALPLDDSEVNDLIDKLDKNKTKDMKSDEAIYKVAYARNVVTKTEDIINIYEYYLYKEEVKDELGNTILYKYYTDKEKTDELATSVEENDNNVFDTNSEKIGMYKYSFKYNNQKGYVFEGVEKVR